MPVLGAFLFRQRRVQDRHLVAELVMNVCRDGWGHLLIVMEGSPKEVWSLLPYGESQHANSPHFNDQAKLHSQRQAKRFWLTPKEILDHTEAVWGDRDRLKRLP